ncbi:unnamed protein product [marine sediment metagenome]|uniref:Uncharacterized protein n=1 Tax=marine sediment metagenome TaxID=412755 RepID=X1ERI6_9ZZZZ
MKDEGRASRIEYSLNSFLSMNYEEIAEKVQFRHCERSEAISC